MSPADVVAGVLVLITGVSAVYWVLSWMWLRQWFRNPPSLDKRPKSLPPLTFLRPLKTGIPELSSKLDALLRAAEPADQVLLGVEQGSMEEQECQAWRKAWPDRKIVIVACRPGVALNPKISKLLQMMPAARHERLLLHDSEVEFPPGWLERFRSEWECRPERVLTAGYRFVGAVTWLQRLDALPALLTLWPGLAVVVRWSQLRFTLGACTAFHREDLEAIGGWAPFTDHLAEDHALGAAFARSGFSIGLSREVLTLDSDPLTWRGYWRHQRRIAVTYRVANPAGFAGMIVTHGVAFAFAQLLMRPGDLTAWLFFCGVLSVRGWTIDRTAQLAGASAPRWIPEVLIVSLVETICWAAAWIAPTVWWAGQWWHVSAKGKLRSRGS